jgi:hypothetical protein
LGPAQLTAEADARTCLSADDPCYVNVERSANTYNALAYGAGQNAVVLSKSPSISIRGQADPLKGGGQAPSFFYVGGGGAVTLDYRFEISGQNDITIPVHMIANGNAAVTGNFASTAFQYSADSYLLMDGPQLNVSREVGVGANTPVGPDGTKSNSFSLDETHDLLTNTAYEVFMRVTSSAQINLSQGSTALSSLVSMASLDPTLQIGPGYSGYSIVYSDGIGDAANTPLPATLPLFSTGLGFAGYLAWRKRKASIAGRL